MCPLPAMTPPASIASTATSHAQGTEAGRTGDAPLARRTSDSTYAGIPISADNVRSRMREVAGDESQRRRRRRWRGQPRRRHRSTRSSRASAKKTMFAAGCSSPTLLALFLRLLARRRAAPAGGSLCDLARHLDGLLGDTQGITGGLLHRPGQLVSLLTDLRTVGVIGMAAGCTGHLVCQRTGQGGGLLADACQIAGGQLDLTGHLAGLLTDLFAYRPVSYTHLRAHETRHDLVCRL